MASLWYYYNLGPKNQQNYTFKCGLQNDASRIILITKPFDYNGVANKLFQMWGQEKTRDDDDDTIESPVNEQALLDKG